MVLFDYDLFVFALCERKNEKNKKIKYRSAEGKNADCVSPVNFSYSGLADRARHTEDPPLC